MELAYDLVVVTHFLGLAALVGGYLVASSSGGRAVNRVMVWGARAQVITGLVLVGLAEAVLDAEVDHARIGVKLVIALAVVALTEIAAGRGRRGESVGRGLLHGAGGLAVLNVLVAALWG